MLTKSPVLYDPSRGLLRDCTTGCGTDGSFYSTSSGPGHQSPPKPHKPWKPLDGPLVAAPQPDLVQHSQGVDRWTIAHSIITDFTHKKELSENML